MAPGVHRLHIRHDLLRRQGLLQLAHGVHPLALDEGGSGLYPVSTAVGRLQSYLDSPVQLQKIQGNL
jgi:hypothetical protein